MEKDSLAAHYLKAWWIIKIRLISVRRSLWGASFSHITFENSLLQIRKILEGYGQLNLLLSHIEHDEVPTKIGSFYEVPKILNALKKINKKRRLFRARMELEKNDGARNHWLLDRQEITQDDENRIAKIWAKSGAFLHDRTAFNMWPYPSVVAQTTLAQNLNSIRADHQWLWNLLWIHAAQFSVTDIFIVNLGEMTTDSKPLLIREEGHFEVPQIEFEPKFLSDFEGEIDWLEFE